MSNEARFRRISGVSIPGVCADAGTGPVPGRRTVYFDFFPRLHERQVASRALSMCESKVLGIAKSWLKRPTLSKVDLVGDRLGLLREGSLAFVEEPGEKALPEPASPRLRSVPIAPKREREDAEIPAPNDDLP